MPFHQLQSNMSQLQQNLNQIAQICSQLSQNEQSNVSKLSQMQQAERNAAQQMQHCAQLCHQVGQQIQQITSSMGQFATQQQFTQPVGGGYQTGQYGNWSNRQLNTSQFGPTGQFTGAAGTYPYWEQ